MWSSSFIHSFARLNRKLLAHILWTNIPRTIQSIMCAWNRDYHSQCLKYFSHVFLINQYNKCEIESSLIERLDRIRNVVQMTCICNWKSIWWMSCILLWSNHICFFSSSVSYFPIEWTNIRIRFPLRRSDSLFQMRNFQHAMHYLPVYLLIIDNHRVRFDIILSVRKTKQRPVFLRFKSQ